MNREQLETIINDYEHEYLFFETIKGYLQFKQVPTDKIGYCKMQIIARSNKNKRVVATKEITNILNSCIACKAENIKNNERYIIFHPCTKSNSNKYQLSFFDQFGAIMDIARDTMQEIIEEFVKYYNDYKIIEVI